MMIIPAQFIPLQQAVSLQMGAMGNDDILVATKVTEKQETRNKKQETRNKKQETRNKKQETRNKKQETRNNCAA